MKCVILQPSYIPWRGYFHQIQLADVFVFYDDVAYDKRGWRNRNKVKCATGTQWLTIPVLSSGTREQKTPINQICIRNDEGWQHKHWKTLEHLYGKAPFWPRYAPLFQDFYSRRDVLLADFTVDLTIALSKELGITRTKFLRSSSLQVSGAKTDRLIGILTKLGATHYISGPSAKSYLEEGRFKELEIGFEYMSYDYPDYTQLYPPFEPNVSIVDLLFNAGPEASTYIWDSVRGETSQE